MQCCSFYVCAQHSWRGLFAVGAWRRTYYSPDIIYAELAHALVKHIEGGYVSLDRAMLLGAAALNLVDEVVPGGDLWIEASAESVRLSHSSYDLLYFVLARWHVATLFALDEKLAALCVREGVNCIEKTAL